MGSSSLNLSAEIDARCTSGDYRQEQIVTAIILTYNEELNLPYCLKSIHPGTPIYVVDSGSSDRTVEIARAHGAHVYEHHYENHAAQWEWSTRHLPIKTPWILALDADFVVTPHLTLKLTRELSRIDQSINGIHIRHIYQFANGRIRYGGTKRSWLRLIRAGKARVDRGDLVDFRFVTTGRTLTWKEAVVEYNRNDDDISVWLRKQDKFALRLAVEEELRRRHLHGWDGRPSLFGTPDQRFAWLRDQWLWLPRYVRPALYFFYRYVIAGGFLDGRAGFLYHFLQGFWLRVIVDIKAAELERLNMSPDELLAFASKMLQLPSGSVREIAVRRQSVAHHLGRAIETEAQGGT